MSKTDEKIVSTERTEYRDRKPGTRTDGLCGPRPDKGRMGWNAARGKREGSTREEEMNTEPAT